ncbi:7TM diverse intracellular signaling domain-containing protein [Luteolibacter sp. Populi]|uniref:sensor histidine kinase n=1 Tax=Luteolibacter sp. Populi TaxID=3230487 RepID=UPI003466B6F8
MTEKPEPYRRLLLIPMGIALVVLGWLAVRLAGSDRKMESLPDTAGSTVESLVVAAGSGGVDQAEASTAWTLWPGGRAILARPGEDLWLRIRLNNPGSVELRGVLANSACYLDHAQCFIRDPAAAGAWQRQESGEWTPPGRKALWGRDTAFPVKVPANGGQTAYLRLNDSLSVYMLPVWWPDETAFHAWQMQHAVAEGLYIGAVLALLFYNAVLWARLRFRDTGPYLLYLVFFAAFMLILRGDLALFGQALGSPVMEVVASIAQALAGIFLMEFARRFLDLPQWSPRAARTLRWCQGFLALLAGCVLLAPWLPRVLPAVWFGGAAAHLVLLWLSWIAWRKGERSPRYLVLISGLICSGLLPVFVALFEALSLDQSGVMVMTASALEMLLLSLAVAYRYAGLQREKIAAQQALLAEGEQRRILQEAYADELGLEVFERTRELQGSVADKDRMIAILAHDLCSPLTGLTYRAEQLAASPRDPAVLETFARDTAGMGRELLSLVGNLVSWSHARGGTASIVTHPAHAVVEPMLALHREAAARRQVSVEAHLARNSEVLTDLVQAQTLVRNLLSNAIKFASREIIVTAVEVPEGLRFAVRDDGPGLPPAVAAGLAAGESDHFAAASGLGLRLCREIARSLEVRLQAVAVAGGGTEISFILKQPNR